MLCLCHLSNPFCSKTLATALTVRGSRGREPSSDPFFLRFTKAALDANLRGQCAMNGAFVRDFQQPMTLLIRRLANQFNVSFNVVGEVPLPTPVKSQIGKYLLAL